MTVDRIGSIIVVRMDARYDAFNEAALAELEAALTGAVDSDPTPRILLDMSGTEYFGSSLLEPIFRVWKKCTAKGGKMAIAGPRDFCLEILKVANLDQLWPIYPDVQTGVKKMSDA